MAQSAWHGRSIKKYFGMLCLCLPLSWSWLPTLLYHHSPSPFPSLLAKSTTTTGSIVVDDLLLLVLPGERPRRLEVQTFLVTFVVVGTAAVRLELLVLELLELLNTAAAPNDATSAAAASSTTTDATTFKLCLDANFYGHGKITR